MWGIKETSSWNLKEAIVPSRNSEETADKPVSWLNAETEDYPICQAWTVSKIYIVMHIRKNYNLLKNSAVVDLTSSNVKSLSSSTVNKLFFKRVKERSLC